MCSKLFVQLCTHIGDAIALLSHYNVFPTQILDPLSNCKRNTPCIKVIIFATTQPDNSIVFYTGPVNPLLKEIRYGFNMFGSNFKVVKVEINASN